MDDPLAPDQGAAAQPEPQTAPAASFVDQQAAQDSPQVQAAAPTQVDAAPPMRLGPQHEDLAYLQQNAADPEVRQKFAKEFGGMPQGFQVPPPTPEDVQYLKDNAGDKKVWDKFSSNFGPDAVPKDFKPTRPWSVAARDTIDRVGAVGAGTMDAAHLLGSQGPSSDQAAASGADLEKSQDERLQAAIDNMKDKNTTATGMLKDAGNALVASVEGTAGEAANFLLKDRKGDQEGAPDQTLQRRFGDYVRAQHLDETKAVENNEQFIRSLPPAQAAEYYKELGQGKLTKDQLMELGAHLQTPPPKNAFDHVAEWGDDVKKSYLDDLSPQTKFRAQKSLVSDDANKIVGEGLKDPDTIFGNVTNMAAYMFTLKVPGDVAEITAGNIAGYRKLVELKELDAPLHVATQLAGDAKLVAGQQAKNLVTRVVAGTTIAGGADEEVNNHIDHMDEDSLMKLPIYKQMIDAKLPREYALEAVKQDPKFVAGIGSLIIGGASGKTLAEAADGWSENYGKWMMDTSKSTASRLGAMGAQAGQKVAVEGAAGGAMMGGLQLQQNVAGQAAGEDVSTGKGVGEAAAGGALAAGAISAGGRGAAIGKGVVKGYKQANQDPGSTTPMPEGGQKLLNAPQDGGGGDTTHADLTDLKNGENISPEKTQALVQAGLVKVGKTTGMPLILPKGNRLLAEAQSRADAQDAEVVSPEKGQPGTAETGDRQDRRASDVPVENDRRSSASAANDALVKKRAAMTPKEGDVFSPEQRAQDVSDAAAGPTAGNEKAISQIANEEGVSFNIAAKIFARRNPKAAEGKVTEEGTNDTRAPSAPDEATDEAGAENNAEITKQEQMAQMHESRDAEIRSYTGEQKETDYAKALNQKGEQDTTQAAYAQENRAMTTMQDAMNMTQHSSRQIADKIPRAVSLSADDRNIESRLIEKLSANLPAAIHEYSQLPGTDGGRIINTDEVRHLSDDYKQDQTVSAAVHEPSSWMAGVMYKRALAQPPKPGQDNVVILTAGGTGSGKSSSVDPNFMGPVTQRAQIVFDTAMNSPETALDKVDAARKAGKGVIVHYIYRNPIQAFVNGSLPRSAENGRVVPVEAHQQTHIGAPKAVKALMEKYKDDPMVQFVATNNVGGGKALSIDPASAVNLPTKVSLETLRQKAKEALKNGQITPEIYERTTGQVAPGTQTGRAGAPAGDRGTSVNATERGTDEGSGVTPEAARSRIGRIEARAKRRFAEEKARRATANTLELTSKKKNVKDDEGSRRWQDLSLRLKGQGPTGAIGRLITNKRASAIDILKGMELAAKDLAPEIKDVIHLILKNSNEATVVHLVPTVITYHGQAIGEADGYFNPIDGSIQITRRSLQSFTGVRTMSHEFVHAVTSREIQENPESEHVKALEDIRQEAIVLANQKYGKDIVAANLDYFNNVTSGGVKPSKYLRAIYGLSSVEELAAETTTSPAFQKLLDELDNVIRKQLPADHRFRMRSDNDEDYAGLVQRIVDSISAIFGPANSRAKELLQEIIYHTAGIMKDQNARITTGQMLSSGALSVKEDMENQPGDETSTSSGHTHTLLKGGRTDMVKGHDHEWFPETQRSSKGGTGADTHTHGLGEDRKNAEGKMIADDIAKNKISKLVLGAAELGALKLVRGVVKYEEWAPAMAKQFGRGIKPALPQLFEIAKDKTRDIKSLVYKTRKGGTYVGGPPGLNRDDLATLRATVRKLAREGGDFRHWYDESSQAVLDAVGGNIEEAKKLAGLLSIFSSGAAVNANTTMALRAWYQHKNGILIDTGTQANDEVALRWLELGQLPDGTKKSNFYGNLLQKLGGDNADVWHGGVTVDRWMMRALGYAKDAPTDPQYAFVADQIRKVAKDLDWKPEEAQAAVWVAIKARWEDIRKEGMAEATKKGWVKPGKDAHGLPELEIIDPERFYGMMLKRSLAHALPQTSLVRAGANYRTELVKHRGQVSWEALPGSESGKLPGMEHMPIEVQEAFQRDAAAALINPKTGNDHFREALGMLSMGHIDGNSAWFNNPGQVMRFRHWSTQPDLTNVDPAFMGKGVSTWKERGRTNKVTSLYPYESTAEQPEKLVTAGAPHQYIAEIPAQLLYDASRDPLGFRQAAMEPIGIDGSGAPTDFAYNHDEFEMGVKNHGYLGYYVSDAGDDALMQGQARLFKPWPVVPVDKYVNFDGYSKAGSQEILYAPMQKGAAKMSGNIQIDPNARAIIESYAAAIGLVNNQNSVGWHRPRLDALVRDNNGIAVHLPNASSEMFLRAYKAVSDAAKSMGIADGSAMEFAPIHSPEGFRFVNWGTMDNKAFQKMVVDALGNAFVDAPVTTPFAADGGLISNDWATHKNGEQYAQTIAKNGHSATLKESLDSVRQRVEAVYAKYAERVGTGQLERSSAAEHSDQAGQLGSPISLGRLTGDKGGLQQDVRGRFGKLGTDLHPAPKLYDLSTLVSDPKLSEAFAKKLGFDIELFSFTSDPSKGIEFRLPKLGKNGYQGGKLWLYDPRVGAASFHDADYTRAWRISHELGHALSEHFMQGKYGDSFRYGRLGQTMQVERGGAGKQKMVDQRPLTLAEAQRAVEWEDVSFRMQRAVLEKMGVQISDPDFAREYNGNISDAMYRVLTGDFTDLDTLTPADKLPDLKSALQLLEDAEGTLAKSQGREPSVGVDLSSWSPVSDADIKAALETRMSGGSAVKFATRAGEEFDYNVVAKTKAGDDVDGPHNELTFASNDEAHDYVDSHDLPPGASHFAVTPVSRNPFKATVRASDGKAPSHAMRAEFQAKYPLVNDSTGHNLGHLEERLVNGNVIVGMVPDSPGTIYLSYVRALEPGHGAGTKAMADVAALADKHGVEMQLNAVPLGSDAMTDAQLQAWYGKLGFVAAQAESDVNGNPEGPEWNAGLMTRAPHDPSKFSVAPFATNDGMGLSDEDAAKVVAHAQRMFPSAQHHLAKSIEDTPSEVQAEAELRGISGQIMAAYVREPDGTHIWMVQNNMTSIEEALDTLVQENVGHDGIAHTFGADVSNLMDGFLRNGALMPQILRMAGREGINIAAARDPVTRLEAMRAAAEEWLAHGAGLELRGGNITLGQRGAVRNTISRLKVWAASKGLPITLDREDALTALRRAHDYVKNGHWVHRISDARDAKFAANVKFAVVPPDPESIKRQNDKMGEGPPEGFKTVMTRILKDARTKTIIESADQLYRIKQYESDAQIPPAESGYISARLSTNVMPQVRTVLEWGGLKWTGTVGFDPDKSMAPDIDTSVKPLNQIHAEIGATNDPQMLRNFEWYRYGKRSNDLIKEGREHSMTQADINDALSYATKYPQFVQAHADIAKLNKNILDFAEKAGVINPESRKLWESDNYAPLFRVSDDAQHGPFASGSLGRVKNPITRLKGGTANVRDITGNTVQNWKALISAATKAHAARVAIDNLTPHGLATREPDMVDAVMSPEGINAALEKYGIEAVGASSMAGVKALLSMHAAPTGADTITIWRGGKKELWRLFDPMLAQSFSALKNSPLASLSNVKGLKHAMGLFGLAKRGVTAAIVHTPIFWLRTMYKDNVNAWVVSRGIMPVTPIVSAITGTIKAVMANQSFRRMSAAGATFNQGRNDPSDLKVGRQKYMTRSSWFGRLGQQYLNLTSSSENASRVTVYENTLKKTASHKLAAFEARDIMDYAMRGASPLVHALVETVPFWGAHSQGMYKTVRALGTSSGAYAPTIGKKIVGRTILHALDAAHAAAWIKGGVLAAIVAANAFHNFSNPKFQELPDLQKETYFHVYAGDREIIRIPKAFESGQIFGTIPEALVTAGMSDNKGTVAKEQSWVLFNAFANALNLMPDPQLLKPLLEVASNADFANNYNPILTSYDQQMVRSQQSGPQTSTTVAWLARHEAAHAIIPMPWLQSPKQLDHLVKGYSAMLGMYALEFSDSLMARGTSVQAPASPSPWLDRARVVVPFIPSQGVPTSTRSLQELNKLMKAFAPIRLSLAKLDKEGTEEDQAEADELRKQDPEAFIAAQSMMPNAQFIADMEKNIRDIRNAPDMGATEKRQLIDETQRAINEAASVVREYRPGGIENKKIMEQLKQVDAAATPIAKIAILKKNGMINTAALVAQLNKKIPATVRAAMEEVA